jgi:hypothetical protein
VTAGGARGLAARLSGVLISPRATYADIVARPRWLGALIVVLTLTILPLGAILSTEVGRQALIDQQLQLLEAFGRTVSDAEYERMVQLAPNGRVVIAAGQLLGLPLLLLVVSGVAYGLLDRPPGGAATFGQLFAVVTFSSVLAAARALVAAPINYLRESLASPTNLAAVVPMFGDDTFGARLLGSFDLFHLWWIVNLAIGLGVLYRRPAGRIAGSMLAIYGTIGVAIASVRSLGSGA